jgi:hypothetical protein
MMSVINQVRELVADLDRPFTIHDLHPIWDKLPESERGKTYKTVGTVLSKMKRYHKEIVAVGYGEKSKSNGKRAVIYESCEPLVEIKKTFGDNLPGWRKVYPEYFRGV